MYDKIHYKFKKKKKKKKRNWSLKGEKKETKDKRLKNFWVPYFSNSSGSNFHQVSGSWNSTLYPFPMAYTKERKKTKTQRILLKVKRWKTDKNFTSTILLNLLNQERFTFKIIWFIKILRPLNSQIPITILKSRQN